MKATTSTRSHRKPSPPPALTSAPITPESLQQQRQDYERARATYEEGERVAGFEWAQQNKIKVARYCQVAAQRTAAFVEGCMNYLAARRTGGGLSKPRGPASTQSEPG